MIQTGPSKDQASLSHLHSHSSSYSSLHPIILRIFENRKFTSRDIEEFLDWDLRALPDLTHMHDIGKASQRIILALEKQQTIGIYGDYDVDGTTSCALFYHFFQLLGVEVELFQPSRFVEGYGLHASSIDMALEKGVSVLITVDCGISNIEAADYALEKGLDLIITDHHKDAREKLPAAYAVVNPNRRDEPPDSPLKALAGVGVAFAVCLQIKKDLERQKKSCPSIYPLLQLVAVGTICDLALLSPTNLKLVRHGLKLMKGSAYVGLQVFLKPEDTLKNFVGSEKVAFHIGPLINSKGRLEHPDRALRVLTGKSLEESRNHYFHLERSNQERKFIQAQIFKEARALVEEDQNRIGKTRHINIVYQPQWHEGVIGIVASKLVETFKVPAIVLTRAQEGGILKASARTAGTLDIFKCLKNCEDLFTKFGGHQAAAGFSLPSHNLDLLMERMEEQVKTIPAGERTVQDQIDAEISFSDVTLSLVHSLDLLEPFGRGNPKPIFRMRNARLHSYNVLKDLHVRWNFSPVGPARRSDQILRGITFNYFSKGGHPSPEDLFSTQPDQGLVLDFTLGINHWGGNEYLQMMVEKISLGFGGASNSPLPH